MQARVAERLQVSRATVSKWVRRYRAAGMAGLADHSSRPHSSPSQTCRRTERRILALRFTRRWGPHRIGYHLHVPQSPESKVLNRYRMPLLGHIDLKTGLAVRKPKPTRYEHANPGDLVHIDVKKLGRIPNGGGWRNLGRSNGEEEQEEDHPDRLRIPALHHQRPLPSRLLRNPVGREERDRDRVLAPGEHLPRVSRHHGQTRPQRQPVLLPLEAVHHRTRRHHPQMHPPLPAANQWQDRTIPPYPRIRMGLRPPLRLRSGPSGHLPSLDPQLPSPQTAYRHRRQITHRPRT